MPESVKKEVTLRSEPIGLLFCGVNTGKKHVLCKLKTDIYEPTAIGVYRGT